MLYFGRHRRLFRRNQMPASPQRYRSRDSIPFGAARSASRCSRAPSDMEGMKVTSYTLAVLCIVSKTLADTSSYSLYHRFIPSHHLSIPTPEFEHYGDISVDFESHQPVARFESADNGNPMVDDGEGMYQLGLKVGDEMLLTTTKSCYTAAPQVYTFVLHLPDTASPPSSLDLKLMGVPESGACPRSWFSAGDRLFLPKGIATAVEIKLPTRIEGPVLAPPPAIDASSGKPKQPEVEKSFFQKYWIAILGVGFFAFSLLGPAPEGQRGGGR